MRVIKGWEQAAAYEDGVERVPAGGHVCRILSAKVDTLDNGSEKLVLALDIEEGSSHDGAYRRMFDAKNNPQAKWPCVYGQFLEDRDGACNPYFKGLILSIEKSNPGYRWAWDEKSLRGKLIGMVFREEEYENSFGEIRTIVRPAFARNVQRIREGVEVPEIKRLQQRSGNGMPSGFTEVQDEALPF